MFGQITERFESIFRTVRGLGKITDKNINTTVREVRRALLEADVNFTVAKTFVNRVKEKAQGTKVIQSVKPGEHFIKIVHNELVNLLGQKTAELTFNGSPAVIMLVGLQGAGKTTTAGKLAARLKKQGKSISLVASDVYRPAAIDQLRVIGKQIDVPVYQESTSNPTAICKRGIENARSMNNDVVIIDSAGRFHVDDEMMNEIQAIAETVYPCEILFVADGMTGQDAVNSALAFYDRLPLTGVILTKMDGDARGGAALSILEVIGKPIKFIGSSEKMDGLDAFDPERIAGRILGFGDVVSLVEKAQDAIDENQAQDFKKKLLQNSFTLDDFRLQLQQLKRMGSIRQLMRMIPGMNQKALQELNLDDNQMAWCEAIINSMTTEERYQPLLIDGSRRQRIAQGSGRSVQEINTLLKQFTTMKKMMKKMGKIKNFGLPEMSTIGRFN
tara:strand:- start:84 stop:1415 length:1332 start_codon:yes stop_codon:yes gene_type:complete